MATRTPNLGLHEKHYDPAAVEAAIYRLWESRDVFRAGKDPSRPPYTIAIPPPNVTGRLHMGHALNNTIQDALIRFKRMDGFDALWVPGTDHAGIATQNVVKKQLDAEGSDYQALGREKVIERIWEWKRKFGDFILDQLRTLGCSCDWSRTAFTMDDARSEGVRVAFQRLYEKGLIYRGKYIVNWCPVDRTALSDDEVETADGGEPGFLWHFRYPLKDGSGHVQIATTRPETMLGDTAVCVNPKDERYRHLHGKTVLLPLVEREIPIIADDYADPSFGTGCLKVTPAHDPNDFQIGLRHDLERVDVMNEDATMNDGVPAPFRGLDRFAARQAVVKAMEERGLLVKTEERMVPVGRSYRSKAVIEYRLCDQWFVKMKPLAEKALAASDAGRVTFHPERWDGIYRTWLENIRDWCISRQIWWGHRIPAWYHVETGEVLVGAETPEAVRAHPELWRQDEDVLDTWFSSALWPLSTLGWPRRTADLERYYPTSLLSTAKDIIFFWVARMVMAGLEFEGEVPFEDVYIHSVICDEDGMVMSKSKGNGIDPTHVIRGASLADLEGPAREARPSNMAELLRRVETNFPSGFEGVGADALRYTLLSATSDLQQIRLSLGRFTEVGKPFLTKLWNATKFALQRSLETIVPPTVAPAAAALEDRWILARLDGCVAAVRRAYDAFHFQEACESLRAFFWNDLCDWYLELVKPRLDGTDAERRRVQETLCEALAGFLRLLHPVMPFLTEELWGHLHPRMVEGGLHPEGDLRLDDHDLLAEAPFPVDHGRGDETLEGEFRLLQEIVRVVREVRANAGLLPKVALEVRVRALSAAHARAFETGASVVARAANLASFATCDEAPAGRVLCVVEGAEVYVNLAEHLDVDAERERLTKELKKHEEFVTKIEAKLANESFVARAPENVVTAERQRLDEARAKRDKITQALSELP